jgi:hypothetical protein
MEIFLGATCQELPSGKLFLSANRQALRISLSSLPWRCFPVGRPTGTIFLAVFPIFL